MEDVDEVLVVIYYLYIVIEVYLSCMDVKFVIEFDVYYVLVFICDLYWYELCSYCIVDGVVIEEFVNVVEQY